MYNNIMKKTAISNQHPFASAGFTLMEVMVAVSIFTIVVTVGIGALLSINSAYRKSQTDRKALDSLTYLLESMSRRMRTAQQWDTTTPGTNFSFIDQDGVKVVYRPNLAGDGIEMVITNDPLCTVNCNPTIGDGVYDVTPEGVTVTPGLFPGSGMAFVPYQDGQNGQRYVQINLGGKVENGRQTSEFMFQTGISKRSFE